MPEYEEFERLTRVEGPHGWIQWKGTEVCMDIHCSCGVHSHIDDSFAYFVRCPGCKQVWQVGAHVKLVPATAEEAGRCLVDAVGD